MADTLLRALFMNFIASGGAVAGHSYDTFPDNDDTTVTPSTTVDTFGSQAQIVSTVGASDVWLCGVLATGTTLTDFKIAISTGLSGATTAKITVPVRVISAAGYTPYVALPYPLRVPSGTRLSATSKQGLTTGGTNEVVVEFATGLSG